MVVQAGAARLELGGASVETRERLAAVEVTGRQALVELRRLLGVLRTDGAAAELDPDPRVQPDIEVVGEAANGVEAIELCLRHTVEVVLMDIRMPVLDGLAATERLRKLPERQRPRVLVVTTFELDEYVYGALRSGAAGFLLKDTPAEALADAVRTIAAGEALLGPTITRRLIEEYVARPAPGAAPPPALALLTERETDVLRALARGLSNAETGRQLFLSEATIKTHVTRILAKLGQRDRLQAVVFAYESGLVQPGEREPSL